MNDIVWDGKYIKIGTKRICFDYGILEVRQSDDMVFVVTEPEGENIDNVFGIEAKNGKMWRIQSLNEIYPTIQPSPYVGVNIQKKSLSKLLGGHKGEASENVYYGP